MESDAGAEKYHRYHEPDPEMHEMGYGGYGNPEKHSDIVIYTCKYFLFTINYIRQGWQWYVFTLYASESVCQQGISKSWRNLTNFWRMLGYRTKGRN